MKHVEDEHQANFFAWLALAYPRVREVTFAIPNGGYRNSFEGKRLKHQGVLAGVPDIFVAIPVSIKIQESQSIFHFKHYHGLFIEMKAPKVIGKPKAKLSAIQRKRIGLLTEAGYHCAVCYGWLEAKTILQWYLKGFNPKVEKIYA